MTSQPNWRTSTYTKSDSCVEVADNDAQKVMVRDTKDRGRGVLSVPPAPWAGFVEYAKSLIG
ncbi:DUF397 domain-containing protein [Streptomyces sp. NBC_01485]|uniref:DUF397 domain-containing protein n=1 Tax=Streptomyces sp. NBC_01485 TaxID=2903884 RepID=UPI002E34137F|nr:DUF397 domain-containing protein [Streptomyces sp. NBC_01485]